LTLSATGLPAGVTVTFSSAAIPAEIGDGDHLTIQTSTSKLRTVRRVLWENNWTR
jgi:hypothetical protein